MKTIMWVNITSLKEQLIGKTKQLEEETMWIGAISKYNPAIEDLINGRIGIWTYRNEVKDNINNIIKDED